MAILDPYKVLLLDMNLTFMFGCDRFGLEQDYATTYRTIGGSQLSNDTVNDAVRACFDRMLSLGRDPAFDDAFPQVEEVLLQMPQTRGIDKEEVLLLDRVIAIHELGQVPPEYAAFLRDLSETHELGLVSNIWSKKQPWLEELDRAGVKDLFRVMVFSSDTSSIKPSPKLFLEAMAAFDVDPSEMVFIGDSLKRDIEGASAVGLKTIWIKSEQDGEGGDYIIKDLLDLKSELREIA